MSNFKIKLASTLKTAKKSTWWCWGAILKFYGDLSAVGKDFKFTFDEYKHIHRAAFVGDQRWIDWFTRLIGPLTRAEEKHFPDGELEAAFEWASE